LQNVANSRAAACSAGGNNFPKRFTVMKNHLRHCRARSAKVGDPMKGLGANALRNGFPGSSPDRRGFLGRFRALFRFARRWRWRDQNA
jgi:hypothetical protein